MYFVQNAQMPNNLDALKILMVDGLGDIGLPICDSQVVRMVAGRHFG